MSDGQEAATSTAVVPRVAPELDAMARMGNALGLAEQGDKGAAGFVRLWVANELGLSPLAGLKIKVTPKGDVIIPAELYAALAARNGYRVVQVEGDDTFCTAALLDADTGEEVGRSTFTIEQAQRAGLIRDGSGWRNYPHRMLWARARKNVVTDYLPGVALGFGLEGDDEFYDEPPPAATSSPAPRPQARRVADPEPEAEEAEWEPADVAATTPAGPDELTADELAALDSEPDDDHLAGMDDDLGPADLPDWPGEAP